MLKSNAVKLTCRALGKEAPPTSRRVQEEAAAPTLPSVRGFLGLGRREADPETAHLVDGVPNSSQGDLDSIFQKMDNPQAQVRMSSDIASPCGPAHAVKIEEITQSGGIPRLLSTTAFTACPTSPSFVCAENYESGCTP